MDILWWRMAVFVFSSIILLILGYNYGSYRYTILLEVRTTPLTLYCAGIIHVAVVYGLSWSRVVLVGVSALLVTANWLHEMATGDLMVCELLCYLTNKYGNSPNDSLKSIILSFYTPIEIASAKDVIIGQWRRWLLMVYRGLYRGERAMINLAMMLMTFSH